MGEYSFYSGAFTEYTTYFLYASDILLALAIFFWLFSDAFKLEFRLFVSRVYTFYNKGKSAKLDLSCYFLEKRSLELESQKKELSIRKIWLYLALFVLILILNLFFRHDYVGISLFQFVKLLEMVFLFFFVYFNFKKEKILLNSLFIIAFSGLSQGLIAIQQFFQQSSLFHNFPFIKKIIGEPSLGLDVLGTANFLFEGERIMRPYGTFPHPNVLAGFLIFSLLITIYLYLESKRVYLSSILSNSTNYNTNTLIRQLFSSPSTWIILLFVQIVALLFTFSRSSWIALLISTVISLILFVYQRKIVSRETIYNYSLIRKYLISYKEIFISTVLFVIVLILSLPVLQSRVTEDIFQKSNVPENYVLSDRNFYNNVSRETIYQNYMFGSGLGTFIFQIDSYSENRGFTEKLDYWQYQPAHNIYFLIASEIGILGLLFFLLFTFQIIFVDLAKTDNNQMRQMCSSDTETERNNKIFPLKRRIYNILSTLSTVYAQLTHSFQRIVSRETIMKNYSSLDKGRSEGVSGDSNSNSLFVDAKSNLAVLVGKLKSYFNKFLHLLIISKESSNRIVSRETIFDDEVSPVDKNSNLTMSSIAESYNNLKLEIVSRETFSIDKIKLRYFLLIIVISFLIIGLFDHYFWTLQQGRIIFWITLSFLAVNIKEK